MKGLLFGSPRARAFAGLVCAVPILLSLITIVIAERGVGHPELWRHGVADEICHLLTAYVCVAAANAVGARLSVSAVLAAAVAIDLDHVPLVLGLVGTPDGTSRPITHSVGPVVLLAAVGIAWPTARWLAHAWAFGVLAHLFRDLGTGAVALWWPFTVTALAMPYRVYFGLTVLLGLVGIWGTVRRALNDSAHVRAQEPTSSPVVDGVIPTGVGAPGVRRRLGGWRRDGDET